MAELFLGVHDDGTVPTDGFFEGVAGGEEEADDTATERRGYNGEGMGRIGRMGRMWREVQFGHSQDLRQANIGIFPLDIVFR